MTAPLPLLTEDEVRSVVEGVDAERRSFGCLSCDRGNLPLKALDIDARIIGTFAHTTVTQTFVNTAGVPVEATYIFPLPDRAAVTRFSMEVAGRRVEGELQERAQARETYDRALRQGKRACIAEEERPGTFSLRVGNLMPGETAAIVLELTGPLPVADGEVTYRFPLVVAPRYIPGMPLPGEQVGDGVAADTDAVPDASRISPPVLLPGYPNPVRLGIEVSIDPAGLPPSKVRSALHAAWADERQGLLRVVVREGERLDRDFILRFCLADTKLRSVARATRVERRDADDTFLLSIVPPPSSGTKRREIVFVLDRSGSMRGWKMIAARRAVARMVDSLRDADRFCVLAFDDRVEACPNLGDGLVDASDRNRFRAVEWLAAVDARGGTEMAQPLSQAATLLSRGHRDRDRVLVFVTDGQVGNESQLLRLLGDRLRGARVFALGIDQAVNAGFLNRLAGLGGMGEAELVENEDRLDEVLARCHRRIDTPVLSELSVAIEGATLVSDTLAPSRLPDVFSGVPAIIAGRLRRSGGARPTLVVRGRLASGEEYEERVPVETSGNGALMPAWARLHLRDLEDRFDGNRDNKRELERRIVQVSLEAKVLCRFTAFVAVNHEVANSGERMHKVTQAVEMPAGWDLLARASPAAAVGGGGAHGLARTRDAVPSAALATKADPVAPPPYDTGADVDEELAAPAESAAVPVPKAAPMPAAPLPPPPSPARTGGLLRTVTDAVSGALTDAIERHGARAAPPPAPSKRKQEEPTTLQTWAARIRALLDRLERGEPAEDVAEDLRLLVDELAHGGVPPAVRKPLEDALAALQAGDRPKAQEFLRPHAGSEAGTDTGSDRGTPPTPRKGFWR